MFTFGQTPLAIGLMGKMLANGPGDLGSIPGRVIPKMVLDTSLLNTQQYKVHIKGKVFANGPGDLGPIPGRVIPKMVLDTSLLNTQQYKVHIKGKVEQSSERSSALPNFLVL